MRRTPVLFAIGLAAAVGLALIAAYVHARAAHQAFQQEEDAARAAGIPLTLADLAVADPGLRCNAAPAWSDLAEQLSSLDRDTPDRDAIERASYGVRRSDLARAQAGLRRLPDLVADVHEAIGKPHCVFRREWGESDARAYPDTVAMYFGACVTITEGRLLLAEGRPIAAARHVALALRVVSQIDEEPSLSGFRMASSIEGMTALAFEDILWQYGTRPGVAAAVRNEIESRWRQRPLRPVLRTEIARTMNALRRLRQYGPRFGPRARWMQSGEAEAPAARRPKPAFWDAHVDAIAAVALSRLRALYAVADLPPIEAVCAAQAVGVQPHSGGAMPMWVPGAPMVVLTDLPARAARDLAQREVVLAAASVMAWTSLHGSPPNRLDQAMRPVPLDPFDMRPLRYRRAGHAFSVWSLGAPPHYHWARPAIQRPPNVVAFRYPRPNGRTAPQRPLRAASLSVARPLAYRPPR